MDNPKMGLFQIVFTVKLYNALTLNKLLRTSDNLVQTVLYKH